MLISKWGNSLGVRLPRSLVKDLRLEPGDELEVVSASAARIILAKHDRRARAVERMRVRALPIPEDFTFDREEIHTR
ncbi:MAG: AbrB/MazE/SpoVT family DNA-binding domain-containing protein [Acidobacteria bacterium]|nr:AbrB/MazE/SpoVT family DNA-binding domain-containing protein [Acidobacteriota bacterium]MXX87159.1 AbrB/MazE/SpoVT family DNA-binding domain-containing protein [Acidobacteriota bacterium]MYE43245.1 AbrB/MazE/SpoVT family DNA-binding domain-containing protein [Acidobacteriota bacterium]MYF76396.1 AbrB/MazE/SpoVT family DNA-binding domain-containing protein [Acidobacteriota bacterium]MYG75831.1 AbrB/MazE/SpoVT family DNA-binding domain-containing protein [Acidobacteriota bacterium]